MIRNLSGVRELTGLLNRVGRESNWAGKYRNENDILSQPSASDTILQSAAYEFKLRWDYRL